ncbi:MAG TPA: sigma-70 family RNA polymerase sigma factor [Planctomycetota bacterium]
MSEVPRSDCAALLAEVDWVRALARHLTADPHVADDLAQEALAAALVRPPGDGPSLRAWLGGVLRNLVRQEGRRRGHRDARERLAARAESQASSSELLERLDSHRALVEAVTRLSEPYRATILLRYFEGVPPAAIARRTGTPRRTVHTRLQRALALLRADLDRAHGDRRTWLLALLPYAGGAEGWSRAATGALVMESKVKLALAALAVVGLCTTLVLRGAAPDAEAARARATPVPPGPARPEPASVLAAREEPEREPPARTPAPAGAAVPTTEPAADLWRGRVLDVDQRAVPGLRVRYSARDGAVAEAESDGAGAFTLARPRSGGALDVAAPGWTCLFRPAFTEAPGEREVVLVVARGVTLAGRVLDASGRALDGAHLAVPLPFSLRARFDAILDGAAMVEPRAVSGPDGRFELAAVPVGGDLELVTTHAGFREDRRALPEYDELDLEIVLQRPEGPGRVAGRVVDASGAPAPGAWVGLGASTTRSGADGEFALELAALPTGGQALRAVLPGHLPAELVLDPDEPWGDELLLVLGPAPLALAGRVLDAQGEPLPGVELWTAGELHFGSIPIEGGAMTVRVGASVEGLLRDDPWTHRVRAGAGGRFRLEGLLRRDYALHVFDREHLVLATFPVAAGEEQLELVLPEEELEPRLAGRVTDLGGEPLAGVEVVLERPPLGGGPAGRLEGRAARTDAGGRFAFEHVSRAVHAVRVQGPELALEGFQHVLAAGDERTSLALAVPLRVHVRIEAGTVYERALLLDARGARLALGLDHGQHSFVLETVELDQGRSESFSVSERATTLVLLGGGVELLRVPVALTRGTLNTLRP